MLSLVVQARRGVSLSVSTVPQPFLRTPTEETALVEFWIAYDGDDPSQAEKLGAVPPGALLVREYNPEQDKALRVWQRRLTVNGTPDVGQLLDAESIALPIKRTTEAPVLNQRTDADHTEVELGIEVSRYTRILRVEVSQDPDFDPLLTEVTDTPVTDKLPNTIPVTRSGATSGALTIYVRASVSAGGEFSPVSDPPLEVVFANNVGAGGTSGSGGFGPGTHVEIEHTET
jgi:hypothetical protein